MIGLTPKQAWDVLREGNKRFINGESEHPSQGIEDRARLVAGQHPHVVLFGCADSRLAAEIIFDQGLGDMFVVRTCLLYTSPSPRDGLLSRMPSSA